ncbi:MAG: DNA-3-methyladenine glycosylase I [Bdellovibrionota bacterium]
MPTKISKKPSQTAPKRVPVRTKARPRCHWCTSDEIYIRYHDTEWGVPVHDDRKLFEMLNLEGAQAGLSWLTILKKREGYRRAFAQFDAKRVARFTPAQQRALMKDEGIVRNRLKIAAVVKNARAFLEVSKEFGTFDKYIWQFVGGRPMKRGEKAGNVPVTRSTESDLMSKDLKRRGFTFVGTTICYAFMQAVGMVDDHSPECFRAKAKVRDGGRR